MNIELRFDYHSQIICIPDNTIKNICDLQKLFLEWVEEQPDCVIKGHNSKLALSYNENDFLKYINEVILKESDEIAFFIAKTKRIKIDNVIRF